MTETYKYIEDEDNDPELWDIFSAQSFPEQKWKIKNIIPDSGQVIIAGTSGDGKSWLALEIARALVLGKPLLDEASFESEKARVLYINQEMAKSELYRRGKLLGFEGNFGRLLVLNRNELNLNDDENATWLIDLVKNKGISVVIIDTFRAVAGNLKDDKAEEISPFFNRFKILKEIGVAIIWLDHTRKPEKFDGKIPKKEQLFGSQYKLGAVEILLMLKPTEVKGELMVYQLKNRLGLEIEPFRISYADTTGEDNQKRVIFSYLGQVIAEEAKKDQARDLIMRVLTEEGKTRRELINIVLNEIRVGEKNTSDAIRELEREAKVHMEKKGRENYYTLPLRGNDDNFFIN